MRLLRSGLLVIALATLGCAREASRAEAQGTMERLAPGESATVAGVTITMNRKQAGMQDADGWYSATSSGGRFRVRMPVPFNDFSTTTPIAGDVPVIYDAIGGKSSEGARFGAICFRKEASTFPPKDWVADTRQSLANKMPGLKFVPVQHNGVSGERLEAVTQSGVVYSGLLLVSGGRACQVSVEYPHAHEADLGEVAKMFLDSFEFLPEAPSPK